ncbi:hypothetical protein PAXRUDRAFT_167537 [Paxillus rubicundulus Ve08.2h10]|uniref:Uncharacterized protein n=1 Tax=Paxillus rubicundulus Ve08.2h10 TaxID=930991 RepID=A0A0D0D9P2_9AGAM|nr:hypothetical protein PAXRUDRAFT_167537 [Paxillus rubicundulus Ve08.2h10]
MIFRSFYRCFPHIVNIAVQTGLKHLTNVDALTKPGEDITDVLLKNLNYLDVLRSDVISSACQLVTMCHASGQHHEDLSNIINEGYIMGDQTKDELRDVTLLHDVVTQWSSIYLMIYRLLELYPACSFRFVISRLLNEDKYKDLQKHKLNNLELQVLADIWHYLAFFHIVQEEVSTQKTPTLSIVLPLYEKLIHHLKEAKEKLPCIAHAIKESIVKLQEYLAASQKTRIYALAIGECIDIKLGT